MMISREAMPTPSVTQSVCCRWLRYTPHLGRNSLGTSLSPSPRKSLICVEKMVSAMLTGEAHHYGVGNEFYHRAEVKQSEHHQYKACHDGSYRQTLKAIFGYDAVDDHDERARGAAYLHCAAAQSRHQEAAYDRGDEACRGAYAARDAEGYGQRHSYDACDDR